jgi:ABC-type proline/glycine betaine transport system ATPase subunit
MKENEIKIVKEKLTMKDDEIKKEIVEAFKDVAADYSKYIQLFPQQVSGRLANYITRRRSLRKIFWRTL